MEESNEVVESAEAVVQRWIRGEIGAQELFGLSPEVMKALAELGYLLYEQGKYDRSQVIFEGLAAVDAANADYQRMLGSIYQMQGKWDAAYYRYTQALEIRPDDLFALTNRGEVLLQLERPQEATADLRQAVALDREGLHPAARRARLLLGR